MKYLIYMSTSVRLFNDADLTKILRESQAYNTFNDITGMMLYSGGSFVQVIEGKIADVDHLFNKIKSDKRHKNIIRLVDNKLPERIFPNWSMSFKVVSPADISKFDAYIDVTNNTQWQSDPQHTAIAILKTFAESNQF